jgi:hypothetical protein
MHSPILAPIVALIAWTLVMLGWTMAVRLPAMKRAGIDLSRARGSRPGQLDTLIDAKAQWPAHNYMHLVEQPTLFYAVAIVLALLGQGHGGVLLLAWLYVALRIAHSLVQATFNKIAVRFALFIASTLVLAALTVSAGVGVLAADDGPMITNTPVYSR